MDIQQRCKRDDTEKNERVFQSRSGACSDGLRCGSKTSQATPDVTSYHSPASQTFTNTALSELSTSANKSHGKTELSSESSQISVRTEVVECEKGKVTESGTLVAEVSEAQLAELDPEMASTASRFRAVRPWEETAPFSRENSAVFSATTACVSREKPNAAFMLWPWHWPPHGLSSTQPAAYHIHSLYSMMYPSPAGPQYNGVATTKSLAASHFRETLMGQEAALRTQIASLLKFPQCKAKVDDMFKLYQTECERLETNRYQMLALNVHSDYCKDNINWYYNHERLRLIQVCLHRCKELANSLIASPTGCGKKSAMGIQRSTKNVVSDQIYQKEDSGYQTSSPEVLQHRGGQTCSYPSAYVTDSSNSDSRSKNVRRFLNRTAVRLMEAWYQQNFDHPYPPDDIVVRLAIEGGISASQVKKWMANKRVRSYNTLSFNGSIHPKKLKRLQRDHARCLGYSMMEQASTSSSETQTSVGSPGYSVDRKPDISENPVLSAHSSDETGFAAKVVSAATWTPEKKPKFKALSDDIPWPLPGRRAATNHTVTVRMAGVGLY